MDLFSNTRIRVPAHLAQQTAADVVKSVEATEQQGISELTNAGTGALRDVSEHTDTQLVVPVVNPPLSIVDQHDVSELLINTGARVEQDLISTGARFQQDLTSTGTGVLQDPSEHANLDTQLVGPTEPSNRVSGISGFVQERLRGFKDPFGVGNAALNTMDTLYGARGLTGDVIAVLNEMISALAEFGVHMVQPLIDQLRKSPVKSVVYLTGLALAFAFHGPFLVGLLGKAGLGALGPVAGRFMSYASGR